MPGARSRRAEHSYPHGKCLDKTSVSAVRLRGPWLSGELANQAHVPVVLKTVQRAVKDVG
jgi:hypothetical protein